MPNKVLEEIEKQILNFVKEYPAYGPERIEAELKSIMKDIYSIVGDIRGIGAMRAIELVKNRKTKEPATQKTA